MEEQLVSSCHLLETACRKKKVGPLYTWRVWSPAQVKEGGATMHLEDVATCLRLPAGKRGWGYYIPGGCGHLLETAGRKTSPEQCSGVSPGRGGEEGLGGGGGERRGRARDGGMRKSGRGRSGEEEEGEEGERGEEERGTGG